MSPRHLKRRKGEQYNNVFNGQMMITLAQTLWQMTLIESMIKMNVVKTHSQFIENNLYDLLITRPIFSMLNIAHTTVGQHIFKVSLIIIDEHNHIIMLEQ